MDWEEAKKNYYIKYGDMPWNTRVEHAFMKQKHRMVWERRYGKIGKDHKEKESDKTIQDTRILAEEARAEAEARAAKKK